MAKDPTPAGETPPVSDMDRQLAEAMLLVNYAVGSGVRTVDGLPVPQDAVRTIEGMALKRGLMDGAAKTERRDLAADDWVAFDLAYYDLARALSPVTAETLRNTEVKPRALRTWCDWICGDSAAIRFTRLLWLVTIAFAAFIVCSAWYLNVMAVYADTDTYLVSRTILELLTPWAYGGLGACVYLLRSAHIYIHQRSFDVRRKPEYLNRILLGTMAGGAIVLFVNEVMDDNDEIIHLSAAALGFLAGYNTDFLFSTIERVMGALLPKVGVETVQKAGAATRPVDINDLVQRMDKAKGADKDLYKSLLAQLTGARTTPR